MTSINGHIGKNAISVLDRGLMFGESVYEVIPIYHGHPYQLDAHMNRLTQSFRTLNIPPIEPAVLYDWIWAYIRTLSKTEHTSIYIQITSGAMPSHRDHICSAHRTPNVIIQEQPTPPVNVQTYESGFKALCTPDQRSTLCAIKTIQLALNTQALYRAQQQGYDDALFIRGQHVVEAASSNIFIVIKDILITPPLDAIVPGVTRMKVLELAQSLDIETQIRPISIHELSQASEIILTSSIKQLKPLIEVQPYFKQRNPGPLWKKLLLAYQQDIMHHHEQHTIDH